MIHWAQYLPFRAISVGRHRQREVAAIDPSVAAKSRVHLEGFARTYVAGMVAHAILLPPFAFVVLLTIAFEAMARFCEMVEDVIAAPGRFILDLKSDHVEAYNRLCDPVVPRRRSGFVRYPAK